MSRATGQSPRARLSLSLGHCRLTAEQVARLETGDVVPLEDALDADVRVGADGCDVAAGRLMQCGGKLAVKVSARPPGRKGGEHA